MDEEGSYDHACMRAELLGLEKPDKEKFLREWREKKALIEQEENLEIQQLAELENQKDGLKNISGGMDELNSILSSTQKKINKFKTACGSLTNLLKIRMGHGESTESINKTEETNSVTSDKASEHENCVVNSPDHHESSTEENALSKKIETQRPDFNKEVDSQIDKLDILLTKAENAQYSMQHQNKQMRKFLNK